MLIEPSATVRKLSRHELRILLPFGDPCVMKHPWGVRDEPLQLVSRERTGGRSCSVVHPPIGWSALMNAVDMPISPRTRSRTGVFRTSKQNGCGRS